LLEDKKEITKEIEKAKPEALNKSIIKKAEPEALNKSISDNNSTIKKVLAVDRNNVQEKTNSKDLKNLIEKSKILLKKIETHSEDSTKDNFEKNLMDIKDDSEF